MYNFNLRLVYNMCYSEVIKNKSTQWILLHISRVKFHENSSCFGGKTHSGTEKKIPSLCVHFMRLLQGADKR